jgi:copper(I)-binding protein
LYGTFHHETGDHITGASPTLQESSVNRFQLAACGVAAALALSGCGAGQVSQTATQEPAVNGTLAMVGPIALRNIHLRATQSTDYVQPGSDVDLLFVAVNDSPDVNDKLLAVSSDIGTISLTGDTTVPANGVLVVGEPDGQVAPLEAAEKASAVQAKIALSKPITNGLTYKFTFDFDQAGETTVLVPISAGEQPRREAAAEAGDTGGHH